MNNKGADQPAHLCSLISAFVIHCLDSVIPLVSISKFSSLYLANLPSFFGCTGRFVSYLVANPKDRFSRDESHISTYKVEDQTQSSWKINAKMEAVFGSNSNSSYVSHIMKKSSLGVCNQLSLKPACSAAEASSSLEILGNASTVKPV